MKTKADLDYAKNLKINYVIFFLHVGLSLVNLFST